MHQTNVTLGQAKHCGIICSKTHAKPGAGR